MKYSIGDHVLTKKKHVCGSNEWEVMRMGIDIKLKCSGTDNIHGGCIKCLSDWFSKNTLCPICRIKIIDIEKASGKE